MLSLFWIQGQTSPCRTRHFHVVPNRAALCSPSHPLTPPLPTPHVLLFFLFLLPLFVGGFPRCGLLATAFPLVCCLWGFSLCRVFLTSCHLSPLNFPLSFFVLSCLVHVMYGTTHPAGDTALHRLSQAPAATTVAIRAHW